MPYYITLSGSGQTQNGDNFSHNLGFRKNLGGDSGPRRFLSSKKAGEGMTLPLFGV